MAARPTVFRCISDSPKLMAHYNRSARRIKCSKAGFWQKSLAAASRAKLQGNLGPRQGRRADGDEMQPVPGLRFDKENGLVVLGINDLPLARSGKNELAGHHHSGISDGRAYRG